MKRLSSFVKESVVLFATIVVVVSFQNCSPVDFTELTNQSLSSELPQGGNGNAATCSFNGVTYQEGDSVLTYLSSVVAVGQTCSSETRVCKNGAFTGSYPFASCGVGVQNSCLFNGQTIAHGHPVNAFLNSTVPYGSSCVNETRLCNDGVLSGSYNFSSCSPGGAASCLFDGKTIPHGGTVAAFPTSTVAFGQTCQPEIRACNNGVLSGTATFGSCSAGTAASCIFNGLTIPNSGTVVGFLTSTVAAGQACAQQTRVCTNGNLSGSYRFSACSENVPKSCLFNDETIAHGQGVTAFAVTSVPYGQLCSTQSQVRTCNNGTLSGTYPHSACATENPTPVNGAWSNWTNSGGCSATCGGGLQNQVRTCSNPAPAYGGAACAGASSQQIACNTHSCTVATNGVCGSAHGSSFGTAPTSNLCNAGNATSVTQNSSTYNWSCAGANGGTTAYCSANRNLSCPAASTGPNGFQSIDGKNRCRVDVHQAIPVGQTVPSGAYSAYVRNVATGAETQNNNIIQGGASCVMGSDGNPTYNWANVVCPNETPAVVGCGSYLINFDSPDGSNQCQVGISNGHLAGQTVTHKSSTVSSATGGVTFQITCHSNGAWSVDNYSCPNKAGATCTGITVTEIDAGSRGTIANSAPASVSAINPRYSTAVNKCTLSVPNMSQGQSFSQAAGNSDVPNRALGANLVCGSNGTWSGSWECP